MSDIEDDYEDRENFAYDYDYDYKPREDRRDRRIELLEARITEMSDAAAADEILRKKCPALQDAYNKYQTILTLTRVKNNVSK